MRMVIHAVGSPYASLSWSPSATCRFLHSLRHLLRSSNTTALVTIPAHLHPTHIVNQYHHASDAVLHFQSFAAHPELAAQFPRYNGLVHVLRLPTTSSMVPPSTKLSVLRGLATQKGGAGGAGGAGGMENNLAFRVKRRKFAIETLHLDVGGGSNERQTPDNSKNQAKEEVQIVRDDAQHQPPKKTFGSKTASSKRPISTNPAEAW